MNLPAALQFLQSEHRRYARDRNEWEIERAELRARVALLEGEKRGSDATIRDLIRRCKMLELVLKNERQRARLSRAALTDSRAADGAPVAAQAATAASEDAGLSGEAGTGAPASDSAPSDSGRGPETQASSSPSRAAQAALAQNPAQSRIAQGKENQAAAKYREFLKECLEEVNYLTSNIAMNPLSSTSYAVSGLVRPRKTLPENLSKSDALAVVQPGNGKASPAPAADTAHKPSNGGQPLPGSQLLENVSKPSEASKSSPVESGSPGKQSSLMAQSPQTSQQAAPNVNAASETNGVHSASEAPTSRTLDTEASSSATPDKATDKVSDKQVAPDAKSSSSCDSSSGNTSALHRELSAYETTLDLDFSNLRLDTGKPELPKRTSYQTIPRPSSALSNESKPKQVFAGFVNAAAAGDDSKDSSRSLKSARAPSAPKGTPKSSPTLSNKPTRPKSVDIDTKDKPKPKKKHKAKKSSDSGSIPSDASD